MPGKMQLELERLLGFEGRISHGTLAIPDIEAIAGSIVEEEVRCAHNNLGGIPPIGPFNLRPWDMEFDGVAVELDECLHFNRYRDITLKSPSYARLPAFPLSLYRRYSLEHEAECAKAGGYGGKWSNTSSERQFGAASELRDLSGDGSPRWKQRAFYDFVKDLSPILVETIVVRVAIWDSIIDRGCTRMVGEVLCAPSEASSGALAALVKQRGAREV
jgi:hypothetical protein